MNAKKVEEIHTLLLKASALAGGDPSLAEVRQHVTGAVEGCRRVLKKKDRKLEQQQTADQQWRLDLATGMLSNRPTPQQAKHMLAEIERQIAEEQSRIDQLNQPPPTKPGLLNG